MAKPIWENQVVKPQTLSEILRGLTYEQERDIASALDQTGQMLFNPRIIRGIMEGASFRSSDSGGRVEVFPEADPNIGLVAYDDSDPEKVVLKVIISGTDVGDVIIGDYSGGQGIKYDKSAGAIYYAGADQLKTFFQATIPTSDNAGDLWVDSDNNNKVYRAAAAGADEIKAGEWVETSIDWDGVGDANTTKPDDNADVTGDHASDIVYRQSAAPTNKAGRLWIDTDNNNIYRGDGTNWTKVGSLDALNLTNAPSESGADVTADHASDVVFRQSAAPSHKAGRLWLDTDDNNLYRSDGSSWVQIGSLDALNLNNAPSEASATANPTSVQSSAPGTASSGDIWIDSDDGTPHIYDGSSWQRVSWSVISGDANAPADNADVTGNNTANDTSNVDSLVSNNVSKSSLGGDGSDGALTVSANTNIDAGGARIVVKNYTSIDVQSGNTLGITNKHANGTILILKSQGSVTIAGTIDLSTDGADGGTGPSDVDATAGDGGKGGGAILIYCGGALDFSGTIDTSGGNGTNGSSGNSSGDNSGDNGNNGTSILEMSKKGTVATSGGGGAALFNGELDVNTLGYGLGIPVWCGAGGGSGNIVSPGDAGGGGGGAGGCILILYKSLTANTGTLTVSGGSAGTGSGNAAHGGGGGSNTAGGDVQGAGGGAGGNGYSLVKQWS